MFTNKLKNLSKILLKQLGSNSVLRQMANLWVRGRNVRILTGIGAGLRFNPGYSNPAYAFGTNELPVQHALGEHLKPGDVFYDVGANVGFFTVIAAKLVDVKGLVYAFEPVPENATFVRTNIELNNFSNVIVDQRAVSSCSGKGELFLAEYSGGSTLSKTDTPPDVKGVLSVDLISIDDLIAEQYIQPPSLVKIDVEGAEMSVLTGMENTIKNYKPILIYEVDDRNEDRFQQKQEECDQFLIDCGYKLERLDDSYPDGGWIVRNTLAISK